LSRPFLVYPAIDLKDGKVVRLQQGRADAATVYSDDPAATARRWEAEGARYLHVVDLDGAFGGEPRNWGSVKAILKSVQIPVQLGGGLRNRADVENAMAMGVTRCVIGSKALELSEAVKQLAREFGKHIVVGIDARDGFVAVKGWTETTKVPAKTFAKQVQDIGFQYIIFTDISTDGMLVGPNYAAISAVCASVTCHVIASGGVSKLEDIRQLQQMTTSSPNLTGVIVGKALYDGRIDLKQLES
jgi:phosphoribosylformimino-5-aminoimidazole carboxamide ribotide isomerase